MQNGNQLHGKVFAKIGKILLRWGKKEMNNF